MDTKTVNLVQRHGLSSWKINQLHQQNNIHKYFLFSFWNWFLRGKKKLEKDLLKSESIFQNITEKSVLKLNLEKEDNVILIESLMSISLFSRYKINNNISEMAIVRIK